MSILMNTEWLNSFIVLAKTGNFTSASNELFITSQTLSYQINKLEKHLNVKLIERGKKNNNLTIDGKKLLEKSNNLIKNFEIEIEKIKKNSSKNDILSRSNVLKVLQTTEWNFDYSISFSIIDFHKKMPDTKIKIYSVFNDELEKIMLKENINIALSTKIPKNLNSFDFIAINKIPYVIVSKIDKKWEDLKYLSPNYHPSRKIKTKESMEDSYNLDIFSDVASLTPAIELCKKGLGAMYVPILSVENELRNKDFKIIKSDLQEEFQDIFIITLKNRVISEQENLFLEIIKNNINKSLDFLTIHDS
ncbi:MAG: LysR family transcriptional regulator [Cyanobacteriota bacterium]